MNKKIILVTGSNGFIGKNLILNLKTINNYILLEHNRNDSLEGLKDKIIKSSVIIHCAAEVKSKTKIKFRKNNIELTKKILEIINEFDKSIKIIYLSTKQVIKKNDYGITKKKSEQLIKFSKNKKINFQILRLPNIYGKFAKVNHNSVVANFCYNISRNKKLYISNNKNKVDLLYVDNLINIILNFLRNDKLINNKTVTIKKDFSITLSELINLILTFKLKSKNKYTPSFNSQNLKNLYATYVSYLPKHKRLLQIKSIRDGRGSFAELIKNNEFGQISLLKIKSNQIRGNHFHNTKIEKFFIVSGKAEFKIRDINQNFDEYYLFDEKSSMFFEMPPGQIHSIKNIGNNELIIIIWSSEIYDKKKPDTLFINNEN